ncbi:MULTISPECIES: LysR substrate-binding domain-containing protein [unclassified Beijerinckia]|uniref:LysR substrate-binding domain-containing protein n=1 Tax=unclassified Beijerinckia TaxID=2638183 RepID=UPI000896CC77|nr:MULTISPECIES: LysR substrate-binding domain-containing protein [unclassified Beijerinckia]MDH7796997.1 LysR family glycine cleavage system transcriptional activator [Beijerinckia sp. GAS462]SEC67986.1 transcriptional regulator, LysR family [Beijerinckia sp. 28-YEA-48]
MRKLPPLRALHAFEAAARHHSFAAAAKELGVTPTAISHQIRQLEETCGIELFRRRPRPLLLTSAGARLYPALRNGFDALASAVALLTEADAQTSLRVTSPNAFASRWLVPRLPKWREANPAVPLEIIGTDAVLDLRADAADVAIRYARKPPLDFVAHEVFRDVYMPVCSPHLLVRHGPITRAADLLRLPLIHYDWMNRDPEAPTWRQWLAVARSIDPDFTPREKAWDLRFREELHAIDAVVGGQGVAICSDVVVSNELRSGLLVKAHPLSLPGYGFYLVSMAHSPRARVIEAFSTWMRALG